ncbi:hypothetical protein D3C79_700740 [compost metagenome]
MGYPTIGFLGGRVGELALHLLHALMLPELIHEAGVQPLLAIAEVELEQGVVAGAE